MKHFLRTTLKEITLFFLIQLKLFYDSLPPPHHLGPSVTHAAVEAFKTHSAL